MVNSFMKRISVLEELIPGLLTPPPDLPTAFSISDLIENPPDLYVDSVITPIDPEGAEITWPLSGTTDLTVTISQNLEGEAGTNARPCWLFTPEPGDYRFSADLGFAFDPALFTCTVRVRDTVGGTMYVKGYGNPASPSYPFVYSPITTREDNIMTVTEEEPTLYIIVDSTGYTDGTSSCTITGPILERVP